MYEDRNADRMSFDMGPSGYGSDGRQSGNGYTYSYEPQNGGNGWRPEKPPRRNGPAVPILTVILCVLLSFGAGVGGATMAYNSIVKNAANGSTVPAPDSGSVLNKDPSSLLDRSDTVYSPYGSAGENAYSISSVAHMVQDAVVVINASSGRSVSAGSGVIISDKGYILTCNHVIENATQITVTVNGYDTVYGATSVGTDKTTDLAVLKINPLESEPLTAATHGISENLVVGEHVVAIGNPLGTLGGTVTDGIISAKARQVKTENGTMTLLQTNAAINSGNSGGGLFNLKGELIGIVNAKYAKSGVEGLAFAIPIDTAYEVEQDLIRYGYKQNIPDIGISFVEVTQSALQNPWTYASLHRSGMTKVGLYVYSSKHCDLKYKDYILTVNGEKVTTQAEYEAAVAALKVGDTLTVTYLRGSSDEEQTVTFEIPQYVPAGAGERTGLQIDDSL